MLIRRNRSQFSVQGLVGLCQKRADPTRKVGRRQRLKVETSAPHRGAARPSSLWYRLSPRGEWQARGGSGLADDTVHSPTRFIPVQGTPWGCWPRRAVRGGPTCGKSLLSEGAGHVGRRRLDQVENSIFSSPSLARQAGGAHRTLAGGTVVHPAGLGAWARKGCTWDEEGWGRRLSKGSFPHCFIVVYGLLCAWLSGRVAGKYRLLALKGRDFGVRSAWLLTSAL